MTETIPFSNINNNNKGELRPNDNITFPFAIEDVDPETNATLLEQFTGQFCFQFIFTKCDFNYIKMRWRRTKWIRASGSRKVFFPTQIPCGRPTNVRIFGPCLGHMGGNVSSIGHHMDTRIGLDGSQPLGLCYIATCTINRAFSIFRVSFQVSRLWNRKL